MEIISTIFSDLNSMRSDIKYKKKSVRNTNTWIFNKITNSLLKKSKGNKIFLEKNDNKNTTAQNLWDAAKAALTGKFIARHPTSRN